MQHITLRYLLHLVFKKYIEIYLTKIKVVVHNDFVVNFRQRCYEISYAVRSTVVRYVYLYIKYEYKVKIS